MIEVETKVVDKGYTIFDKIEIEVRTHQGFIEHQEAIKKGLAISQIVGRHQFIYKRNGIEISLAEFSDLKDGWFWEIYCIKGKLFEDTERFGAKQAAENKVIALLTPEDQL